MKLSPKTVLVLGAGFTKAFVPGAPLLRGDYGAPKLMKKFAAFPHALRILELELERSPKDQIDIERLMTRLQGRMPYDFEQHAGDELTLLLSDVKKSFNTALDNAKAGMIYKDELAQLATLCVTNKIPIITFNYDDVLDQALWEVKKIESVTEEDYWHPDGGYGYFCRPSSSSVGEGATAIMDRTSMPLLKLHGSVNWRIRRGYSQPYSIDAVLHHEPWLPNDFSRTEWPTDAVERHLESEPFIVPPILTKDTLIQQPILRLVWSQAFDILRAAEQVVFVGYSLPVTDIAAGFLFSEAIDPAAIVRVVNFAKSPAAQREIRGTYRRVFPGLSGHRFDFDGALEWARTLA